MKYAVLCLQTSARTRARFAMWSGACGYVDRVRICPAEKQANHWPLSQNLWVPARLPAEDA